MESFQVKLCHYCGVNFDSNIKYMKHLTTAHEDEVEDIQELVICSLCGEEFEDLNSLNQHKREWHSGDLPKSHYQCQHCEETFQDVRLLANHHESSHNGLNLTSSQKSQSSRKSEKPAYIRCKEKECGMELPSCNQLRKHLTVVHNIPMKSKIYRFSSVEEFERWKVEMETETKSNYLLTSGTKFNPDYVYRLYDCNRSGKYICKIGDRKRKLKRQGSCKIQGKCPSQLTVKVYNNGGNVEVRHHMTHYGHDLDLSHIRLSKSDRSLITDKIASGMSTKQIIQELGTQQLQQPDPDRLQLMNRKTILNIRKSVGASGLAHSETTDDFTAAHLKVQTLQSIKTADVIMYKQHGVEDSKYPQLLPTDYALGLTTEDQMKFTAEFGMRVICLDWGQCLTSYRYYLLTLIIIDDMGEAVPIAWLQTKAHNYPLVVQYFLESLKITYHHKMNKNFPIPSYILGEHDPDLTRIWLEVFGPNSRILGVCGWHINKLWIKKLNLVKGIHLKTEIYGKIKSILGLNSLEEPETKLSDMKFFLMGNKATRRFCFYFFKDIIDHEDHWSRFIWDKSALAYLQSFEKLYQYMFVNAKVNCRLDQCVVALLFYQNKLYANRIDRLNKIINRELSLSFTNTHSTASTIPSSSVSKTSGHVYKVENIYSEEQCNIVRCYDGCQESLCLLCCDECNICSHILTCDCTESITKAMLCKHCHAVAIKYPEDFTEQQNGNMSDYELVANGVNLNEEAENVEESVIIDNLHVEVDNASCIEVIDYADVIETNVCSNIDDVVIISNEELCKKMNDIITKLKEVNDVSLLEKIYHHIHQLENIISGAPCNERNDEVQITYDSAIQIIENEVKMDDLGSDTIYVITNKEANKP